MQSNVKGLKFKTIMKFSTRIKTNKDKIIDFELKYIFKIKEEQ